MRQNKLFGVLRAFGAFLALTAAVVKADVIDHSKGFDPHDDLTANGDASFPAGTTVARITRAVNGQTSSIFGNTRVCVDSFATSFNFKIGPFDPLADGMTFTIQGTGATAIGSGGGGLAYGKDNDSVIDPDPAASIPNSVAIKIDFYNNHSETDNSTGLFTNGRSPTVPKSGWVNCTAKGCNPLTLADTLVVLDKRPISEGGTGINFHSNHEFRMDLFYDVATLTLLQFITDTQTTDSVILAYPVDIPAIVGGTTAYVGFTGATGGINAQQDVLSWRYDCPAPTK